MQKKSGKKAKVVKMGTPESRVPAGAPEVRNAPAKVALTRKQREEHVERLGWLKRHVIEVEMEMQRARDAFTKAQGEMQAVKSEIQGRSRALADDDALDLEMSEALKKDLAAAEMPAGSPKHEPAKAADEGADPAKPESEYRGNA